MNIVYIMQEKRNPEKIRLQRISNQNIERIEKLGRMTTGDSFNDVLSRALDECEKRIDM
jgi:hypothetical protein